MKKDKKNYYMNLLEESVKEYENLNEGLIDFSKMEKHTGTVGSIMGYDGSGNLPTHKKVSDVVSILERFYFAEDSDDSLPEGGNTDANMSGMGPGDELENSPADEIESDIGNVAEIGGDNVGAAYPHGNETKLNNIPSGYNSPQTTSESLEEADRLIESLFEDDNFISEMVDQTDGESNKSDSNADAPMGNITSGEAGSKTNSENPGDNDITSAETEDKEKHPAQGMGSSDDEYPGVGDEEGTEVPTFEQMMMELSDEEKGDEVDPKSDVVVSDPDDESDGPSDEDLSLNSEPPKMSDVSGPEKTDGEVEEDKPDDEMDEMFEMSPDEEDEEDEEVPVNIDPDSNEDDEDSDDEDEIDIDEMLEGGEVPATAAFPSEMGSAELEGLEEELNEGLADGMIEDLEESVLYEIAANTEDENNETADDKMAKVRAAKKDNDTKKDDDKKDDDKKDDDKKDDDKKDDDKKETADDKMAKVRAAKKDSAVVARETVEESVVERLIREMEEPIIEEGLDPELFDSDLEAFLS